MQVDVKYVIVFGIMSEIVLKMVKEYIGVFIVCVERDEVYGWCA